MRTTIETDLLKVAGAGVLVGINLVLVLVNLLAGHTWRTLFDVVIIVCCSRIIWRIATGQS